MHWADAADMAIPASPRVPRIDLETLLRERGLLTAEAAARARVAAQESGERLATVLTRLGLITEAQLANALAEVTGLAVLAASDLPRQPISIDAISPAFMRENRALPVSSGPEGVTVATADPLDPFVLQAFAFTFDQPVTLAVARASDIDAAIDRLYDGARATADDAPDQFIDADDVERLKDMVSDAPVIRAVNRLIADASDAGASDIHLEPTDDSLTLRFRIDGALHEQPPLPAAMRAPLVSRIKVMAGLNVSEHRLPQDGRLRVAVRGHDIDLRVATAPGIHGESAVLRILDRSRLTLDYGALGFEADTVARMRAALSRPHGIVLVTGPTGSGKTTTLYTALSELNASHRKLLTIEDPIEYRLPGVIQTQVNPQIGFTFAAALRSFLRQDPDIIMVGEIRDGETAAIAVQAALTGHTILSTLHTNDAVGAIGRLFDIGVEPFLLGSVLNGVLAQRLARRVCPHCSAPASPEPAMLAALGLDAESGNFRLGRGCGHCNGTGHAGRIALHEFLAVDDAVASLILRRADAGEIAAAARAAGMKTLREDALAKARAGLTTLEEALRVTAGE